MPGELRAGWVAADGVVRPCEKVAGYAARRQVVRGNCYGPGCKRHVMLDPEILCKDGLAEITMRQVQGWWRCNRAGGCAITFFSEAAGLPLRLADFIGLPHVRLRLKCRTDRCKFHRVWPVEAIIKGLQARGAGDERTEIATLGAKMTSACPLCGKVSWEADVLWAKTDTIGWRSQGDRYFDRYNTR